jgi:hypothetical protein
LPLPVGSPINCKHPLSKLDLRVIIGKLSPSQRHDDKLFLALLFTGFHGLLRLGELCFPDRVALQNYKKVSLCHTVVLNDNHFSFFLPGHKGDHFYEGNTIIIEKTNTMTDPYTCFSTYLLSHDYLHPFQPELWLCENGEVPTCRWFLNILRKLFTEDVGGQSMRAGGATSLAEVGVEPSVIQAISWWTSSTFQIYI